MAIKTLSQRLWVSVNIIYDPELIYVTVLSVDRNGIKYDKTTGTPGNRQYVHDEINGLISFNIAGTGTGTFPPKITALEKVNVIYRT